MEENANRTLHLFSSTSLEFWICKNWKFFAGRNYRKKSHFRFSIFDVYLVLLTPGMRNAVINKKCCDFWSFIGINRNLDFTNHTTKMNVSDFKKEKIGETWIRQIINFMLWVNTIENKTFLPSHNILADILRIQSLFVLVFAGIIIYQNGKIFRY